jgi:hypothetical protein
MYRKLEPLNQEYYYLIMKTQPMAIGAFKRLLWLLLALTAFCELWILFILYTSSSAAFYMQNINHALLFLFACYGVFVLITSFGRMLQRHFRLRIGLLLAGIYCVLLSIWALCTTMMCTQNDAALYLVGQLVPLVFGAFFTIFLVKRTENQLLKGYYREGQGGFFGEHHGFVEKLLSPFVGVSTTGMGLTVAGWGLLFNRFRPRTDTTPWWAPPLMMAFLFFIFCVLSFLTVRFLLWFHMNRKFGFEMPLLDNEEKGSKKR